MKQASHVALISHINPDIDTIGSALATYWIFQEHFPQTHVDLICASKIPNSANILPWSELYQSDFIPSKYDLILFFDSWSKSQTGFSQEYPTLYDGKTHNTINIDHHASNELYARQNILNTTYASTTMILLEMFFVMWLSVSQRVATCLLAWIYTDTGWFQHSNTSKLAYNMASYLVHIGADRKKIVERFFKNNSLAKLKLFWKIIQESFISHENVLHAYVNKTLLESVWCDYDDISGVIDVLNTVEWVDYTTLLTQKWEYIRASLRTLRDDIDVSAIAKQFSGWGHRKSSGFTAKWTAVFHSGIKIIDSL